MIKSALRSGRKNYHFYSSTLSSTEFIQLTNGNRINSVDTSLDLPLGIVVLVKGGSPKWFEGVFEKDENTFFNIGALQFFGDEEFIAVVDEATYESIKHDVGTNEDKAGAELPVVFIKYEAIK